MSIHGNGKSAQKRAGTLRAPALVALLFALVLLFAPFPQAFAAEIVPAEAETENSSANAGTEKSGTNAAAKSAGTKAAPVDAALAKTAREMLRDVDFRLAFRFRFSGDSPVPEVNRGDWPWVFNRRGNGVIEQPKIAAGGVAKFSNGGATTGGTGTIVAVDFNCTAFLCAFEIASVKNATPAVVVGFGHALTGKISGGNGFYVKATRNSIQLENQKTGEIVVEAKNLELGEETFKKIIVANTPRGSAIFADGEVLAYSTKFVSGRSRQPFGIGGSAGLPGLRYGVTHAKLNADLRNLAVFEGNLPRASTLGFAMKKLLFRFDFTKDATLPAVNNADWTWRASFNFPKIVDGVTEFSDNPLHTGDSQSVRNVSGFDTSAFACAFEIAEVLNRVPAVVACCGHGMLGKIRAQTGFFIKATCESIILEDQRERKIVLEVHGLALEDKQFKKILVVSSPRGSMLLVDGFVIARSDKSIYAGNAVQPFGIGGAPGLPNAKNPDEYRRLRAKLKNFSVFEIEEIPLKSDTKKTTPAKTVPAAATPETQNAAGTPAISENSGSAETSETADAESAETEESAETPETDSAEDDLFED